jgi:ubiquinone/menaquinone biosynthesis C-methylase UbiE
MVILDCGCGKATIAMGLAEAVPAGRVIFAFAWCRVLAWR